MKRKNVNSLLKRVDRVMAENPTADYQMVKMSCKRDPSRGRIYTTSETANLMSSKVHSDCGSPFDDGDPDAGETEW